VEKPYFLSESDYQKFGKLDFDAIKKIPKNELKNIYDLLKRKYNLNPSSINFPVNPYFIQRLITSDDKDPINNSLAANVYIRIMGTLGDLKDRNDENILRKEFIGYLEKNIEITEKKEKSEHGIEYSNARYNLAHFLLLLDEQ